MRLTERPLFYWVLKRYRGFQFLLLLIILVSLFFKVYPLEMQRQIINVAINLKMLDKLYLYCGLYMGAVLIAGLLKYLTNTMQAILGEKILIDMRQEIYQHMLQLPLPFFHRTQTGNIISSVTAELNAISSFLGSAVSVPIAAVLTFITFLGFMIYLNPTLGLISMVIYPLEMLVIPLLQSWYNTYNRKRVLTNRRITSLVNESVTGIHEVQGNAGFLLEYNKLTRLIKRLYTITVRLSIIKYGIKFSNNLFQSIGPFLLFLVGGYFAIKGEFTMGALVAFLSAYEKVYDPWKEVIEYYQTYQDARVRYKQIMELLDHSPDFLLEAPERSVVPFSGTIEAENINYNISASIRLLSDVSFRLEHGQHLALIGYSGSGKSTLSMLISQLIKASSGSLKIGGHEINTLSKLEVACNIGSVAQNPFIFTGTVRDNLLYSCSTLYLNGLVDKLPERQEIIEIVKEVGLAEDVIRWGLRSIIQPQRAAPMISSFMHMRKIIQKKLMDEFPGAIEFYNADLFQHYLPIAKNIIFGSYGGAFSSRKLIKNKEFRIFLRDIGLEEPLTQLGFEIARETIEFLGDFKNDAFFFQGSPMNPDSFQDYERLTIAAQKNSLEKLKKAERDRFLLLALGFTPGIHKITTITTSLQQDILSARRTFLHRVAGVDLDQCRNGTIQLEIRPFQEKQPSATPKFTPFCINQYLNAHSLGDNILFGTVIDRDLIRDRLGSIALEEFEQQGLLDDIMDIGLDFHVGSKGDNLSGGQKQKIALARALLKKSPILVLDEATASLDNSSQARIQRYIDTRLKGNTTVVSVIHRLDMISGYDHIVVMKDGTIVESGTYNDLLDQKGTLYDLINDTH